MTRGIVQLTSPRLPYTHVFLYSVQRNPVGAVLYRCGHQCACLQCAYYMRHERLGCPLCRAPIEDVVRVYK